MFSAVDGQLEAREPDVWAGRLSFLSAFSHMECEILVCRRPKLSLPSLPAGVGRARGRRVCGMSVGPRKRKKENRQPEGGMGGRHAATTQGF